MSTKLTLTIQGEIIKRAKQYAKEKNQSLSAIIENYLKSLTKEVKDYENTELNESIKLMKGAFKEPKNMDYKKELNKRKEDKYL